MSLVSTLAAGGVWPAVPAIGYALFTRRGADGGNALPALSRYALMAVAGLAVWSLPLLGTVSADVYRPDLLGLVGWMVTTAVLVAVVWRARAGSQLDVQTPAASPANEHVKARPRARSKRRRTAPTAGPESAHTSATSPRWHWLLAVGLVIAAALYFGFPAESIYGGRDEGVYANHAVHMVRHGTLDVPYPYPPEAGAIFSRGSVGFPGFYRTVGTMTVQFGHLFPVWLAQAFATGGHHALFRLPAAFALLSLAVFYGVCRTVLPIPYAVIATLFLAFNPSQLWTARITLSEIFTQLFMWSGLLLLLQALRTGGRPLARWSGIFLALSAFVRFDSFLLVPLLLLAHVALRIVEEPTGRSASVWSAFYQTAVPGFALAFAYYLVFSAPYLAQRPYLHTLAAVSGLSALILLAARRGVVEWVRPWLTHRAVLVLTGIGMVGLAAYAYWIRPLPVAPPRWVYQYPGFLIDLNKGDYSVDSLVDLSLYLSPVVIWAAVGGWFVSLWLLVRNKRDVASVVLLVMILGFSVVYLYKTRNTADHLWWVRRFVPVVVPGFILCATLAAHWLLAKLPRGWSTAAAAVVVTFLLVFTARADRLILTFAEDHGYFTQLQRFAEALPRDEVIVTHGFKTWEAPLYVAFDRKIVPVRLNTPEGKAAWDEWSARQLAHHQAAYLLTEVNEPHSHPAKIGEFTLSRTFTEPTINGLPKKTISENVTAELFKVTEHARLELPSPPPGG